MSDVEALFVRRNPATHPNWIQDGCATNQTDRKSLQMLILQAHPGVK